MRSKNIEGFRFGRLTAIKKVSSLKWLFLCDCGIKKEIYKGNVLTGKTKSCGCLLAETTRERVTVHGMCGTKIYRAWRHMLDRCKNKNVERYGFYGGKGIKVCQRWKDSFSNFLSDMGLPPTEKHSIGRINNDLNYCPSNCRWETAKQQIRNRSNTKLSEDIVAEIRKDLAVSGAEWGRRLGCSKETINMVKRNEIWI